MSDQFWIQIAVYILTGLIAVWKVSATVEKRFAQCATKDELKDAQSQGDDKRTKAKQNFEGYKEYAEKTYTRQDLCGKTHEQLKETVDRMERAFADFRHDIRGSITTTQAMYNVLKDDLHEVKEEIIKRINGGKP